MKTMTKIAGMLAVSATLAATAHAAEQAAPVKVGTIASVNGKVMIHGGSSYRLAEPGWAVSAGDRILTLQNARADIAFAHDCKVHLGENSVLAIEEGNMCADLEPVQYAQAIGATRTDAPVVVADAPRPPVASAPAGGAGLQALSDGAAAVIGFGVVGATAHVGIATAKDRDTPISGQ